MRKIAFSSNAFKKNTLAEAIDFIGDIGYVGAEIMADVPHAYPASFDSQKREELLKHMSAKKLAVSNVNAFTHFADGDTYHPTWIEDDERAREMRITHTMHAIELAGQIGAKTLSLQPGGPMIGTTLTREKAGERFAEGLMRVLPLAKRHNVILAVEPEPGLFIETSAEYLAFKNEFFRNEPQVLMNCDVGHLFCVGDDPASVIHAMPEHVAHVHLEDIGSNRVHQHLTPGKGVINFQGIFEALDNIRYSGWTTVELYPYETTAAGVAKRAWDHLEPLLRA